MAGPPMRSAMELLLMRGTIMSKGDYDKGRGLLALRGNTGSLQTGFFFFFNIEESS